MHQFKAGDLVKTNYEGTGSHASHCPNGFVFRLKEKYKSWDNDPAWWDENRRYYWKEKWLLPVATEKVKSGFGKWISSHDT